MHIRLGIVCPLADGKDLRTLLSINENAQDTLRHTQKLTNLRNSTDIVEIVRCWIIILGITLRHDKDTTITRNGALDRGNGSISPHVEVDHQMGIDHKSAKREKWESSFLRHCISFRQSIKKRSSAMQAPFVKYHLSWQLPSLQHRHRQWLR